MDYNNYLNPTLVSIKPSGIRKFFSIAEEMDNVISLGVGEPDFKTPWHIRQTGINSLEQGATRYTANAGLSLLRDEIADYYKRKFNVQYDPKTEITVTVGGSEGIDRLFARLYAREMKYWLLNQVLFATNQLLKFAAAYLFLLLLKMRTTLSLCRKKLKMR